MHTTRASLARILARAFLLLVLAALGSVGAPPAARGQAYLDWAGAARTLALAGAGSALADDPQAAFHAPAGIASLSGTHVRAGFTAVGNAGGFDSFDAGRFDREAAPVVRPSLFVTHEISRRLHGGVSITSPWNASVEWERPDAFPGRFRATSTRLTSVAAQSVLAMTVAEGWSAAAGIRAVYTDLELERFEQDPELSELVDGGPIALARTDLGLDGVGVGWVAAVHGVPHASFAVGVQMRSEVEIELNGPARFDLVAPAALRDLTLPGGEETVGERLEALFVRQNARSTLRLPRLVVAGAAWEVLERVRLVADLQWAEWSAMEELPLAFRNPDLDDAVPLGFTDAWAVRVGAELRHGRRAILRLGFAHEQSPAGSTVTPLLPDADRDAVAGGFGFRWGEGTIDLGYRWSVLEDREGAAFPDPATVDGVYEASEHRLAVSVHHPI